MDGDTIKVEDSILLSIKKLLGMDPEEFDQFDSDIIMYISATIEILNQIGVDIPDNFTITDKTFLEILATLIYKVKSTDIKGTCFISNVLYNENLLSQLNRATVIVYGSTPLIIALNM